MLKKSYYICCLNTDEIAEYIGNKIESLRSLKLWEALQLCCQKRLVHPHQTLQPYVEFEMAEYWEVENQNEFFKHPVPYFFPVTDFEGDW